MGTIAESVLIFIPILALTNNNNKVLCISDVVIYCILFKIIIILSQHSDIVIDVKKRDSSLCQ